MADIVKIEFVKPKIPEDWDYDESVKIGKQLFLRWKDITIEMANHFRIAREALRSKGGKPFQKSYARKITRVKTWGDYCQEVSSIENKKNARDAFNYMLRCAFPKELDEKFDKEIEFQDRSIIPYGENIYFLSNKIQKDRKGDFVIIKKDDPYPTLKRRSWFFHEDGREFTLREYAQVQTFPDDFKFVGTYNTIKDQIGNAVAPKMAAYIGQKLKGKTFGDLFAGCGGLSYGLESIGKKAIWAVEGKNQLAKTYHVNHPFTKLVISDIKELNPKEFELVDIIVGGPPCQGFSLSGKRFKNDPRNKLYKEFLRFVDNLKPKEILMENVKQIKEVEKEIISDFKKIGYKVETFLIKGEEIGMRQHRNRYFFIGKRNDN